MYQAHITEATHGHEVRQQGPDHDASSTSRSSVHNEFIKARSTPTTRSSKCANMTAELLAETAMAWHLEAVGSGGVRGTGDKKTMALAAYLYKKVVDNFTHEEFAKFEFPRIVKDDWPTHLQDQVRDGRLALLPEGWAEVRSGVRLGRRRGPERRRGARGRVRRGALLPEHLRPRRTRATRTRRAAATCPRRRKKGRRGEEGRARRSSSPRTSPTSRRA